jgi:hypothetical protein
MIDLQYMGKISYKLVKRFIYFNDLNNRISLHLHPHDYDNLSSEYRMLHGETKAIVINGVYIHPDTSELVPVKCVNIIEERR